MKQSHSNQKYLSQFLLLFLFLAPLFGQQKGGPVEAPKSLSQNNFLQSLQNINNISYWVRADGLTGRNPITGGSGGHFPNIPTFGPDAIFADGLMWGGIRDGGAAPRLRVGGTTYSISTRQGWIVTPGDGVNPPIAIAPDHPRARLYRVRPDFAGLPLNDPGLIHDAAQHLGIDTSAVTDGDVQTILNQYSTDWQEWPTDLGAPFYDVNDNDMYEPGLWIDLDGDGVRDRGEVEEPGLQGADQVSFMIFNDVDSLTSIGLYGSPPIGLEIQLTLWSYNSEGPLGNTIFKRYRIFNKSGFRLDNFYAGQWADQDLGTFTDDFLASDTTLDFLAVYNGTSRDDQFTAFGLPPAAYAHVILQGFSEPSAGDTALIDFERIPDFRNLGMTSNIYFPSGGGFPSPVLRDYDGSLQWYNLLRGFTPTTDIENPTPYIAGAGPNAGQPTIFPLSGDPVSGYGDVDGRGDNLFPGDRRGALNCGPVTLENGAFQEIVIAMVAGLDPQGDHISSYSRMRDNVRDVRSIYYNDMKFPRMSQQVISAGAQQTEIEIRADLNDFPNAAVAQVTLSDPIGATGNIMLTLFDDGQHYDGAAGDGIWANRLTVSNRPNAHVADVGITAGARTLSFQRFLTNIRLRPLAELRDWRVTWENALQDSMINPGEQAHLGFTIYNPDQVNPVSRIEINNLQSPAQFPDLQDPIIAEAIPPGGSRQAAGQYFLLQAPFAGDTMDVRYRVMSDNASEILLRHQPLQPWTPAGNWQDTLAVISVVGSATNVFPIVADSSLFQLDRQYSMTFSGDSSHSDFLRWNLSDAQSGQVLLTDQRLTNEVDGIPAPVVDGIMFVVRPVELGFLNISTVANGAGPLDPAEGAAAGFAGFPSDNPTDRQQVGAGKWLIHTGDNGNRGSYENFLLRITRSGDKWSQIIPNDYEIRFTAGGSAAIDWFQYGNVFNVPFELWNIGSSTPDDPSDDYRMIPVVIDWDLDQQFDFIDGLDHTVSAGNDDPQSDWIYFYDPIDTTPGEGGYLAEENILLTEPFRWERSYAREVIARLVFVNWNGGDVSGGVYNQDLPEEGTVFRIESNKPNYPGDSLLIASPLVAIGDRSVPKSFALDQNYPNPFNPATDIRYQISDIRSVELVVYDVLGRKVKTLVNKKQQPGNYRVTWNGRSDANQRVASGLYFYRLTAGDFVKTRKMILLR